MSSPGIRPRNKQPAARSGNKSVSPQELRVLAEDSARAAAPSVVMPRAKTELTELLAGDKLLCVRRHETTPTSQTVDVEHGVSDADARSHSESSTASLDPQSDDLARVVDAWPRLPRNLRAAVLAMIRESASPNG